MASVRLERLTKEFGKVIAVDDLTLDIAQGEFLVLLGPSGCGKTTTLRMVAGLETPSRGRIVIGKRDVTHLHPRERGCAMVFQDYALYPHMSVHDNLSFALRNLRYPRKEIDTRVTEVAELLQIADLLGRRPRQLSGGQRQRVALGRAIIRRPEVYLFDEPLSNLDAKLRVAMRIELAELHVRLQTTSIYVTHDQVEAMTLGTRICLLKDGLLQQTGSPADLYNRPANLFVAGFIGSPATNLLGAELVQDGGLCVDLGGVRLSLPVAHQAACGSRLGQKVVFGVRPECIRPASQRPRLPTEAVVRVRPRVVEQLGKEALVYFTLGTQSVIASAHPDAVSAGQDVDLILDMDRSHLFDASTGRIIC